MVVLFLADARQIIELGNLTPHGAAARHAPREDAVAVALVLAYVEPVRLRQPGVLGVEPRQQSLSMHQVNGPKLRMVEARSG